MLYLPGQNYHNCNISKCTYNSFKPKFISTYNLSDTAISSSNFQNNLGLILSKNLTYVGKSI